MTRITPRSRTVAAAAACYFVVYVLMLIAGRPYRKTLLAVDDLLLVAVSIPPLVFCVLAARSVERRLAPAWSTLAVGLLSWNLGEWVWTFNRYVRHESPVPSLSDAFYLFWHLTACVALLQFWDRGPRRANGRILLDGFIVGGSLFLVSWMLTMGEVYTAGAATRTEFIIAMAYPVADWMLVTVAAIVLVNAQNPMRPVLTLVTLGLTAMAVNSSGYGYLSALLGYSTAEVVNVGWTAGLLLLTVAAAFAREMRPPRESAVEMPGWASVWLPYAPLVAAVCVVAYGPQSLVTTPLVTTIGALLIVAVLARQFLAVRENRRLLALVSEQALRDPLTRLGNRALFTERLDSALRRLHRARGSVAVLSLDMNNFKMVNDTLGHAAGDQMLRVVSRRLTEAVCQDGDVARIGGDEFAVIIEGGPDLADKVARRIHDAFEPPVSLDGVEIPLRPSIGRAVATAGQPDLTADELLVQADIAMYSAKRSRSSPMVSMSAVEPVRLLQDLRRAVERQDFSLVYQPKFDLASSAMVGVEALLRWPHPELGVLMPDQFLPLVRHYGMTQDVTDLVLDRALDDARDWRAAGAPVVVSVNVFPPSLSALLRRIDHDVSSRGLTGSALIVEITEDFLVDDVDGTRWILSQLRDRGIRIAIDDFGIGYSGLRYLRDFPTDEVKIDGSLISSVLSDPAAALVVRAIINLSHALGKVTVAEGVESSETAEWLRQNGCDTAQGYHFSPPLTAAETLQLATTQAGARDGSTSG